MQMEKPTARSLLIDAYALFEGVLSPFGAIPDEALIRSWQRQCQTVLYPGPTIEQNALGRFILRRGVDAWSGRRWVPVTALGMPAADVQVCNFASVEEARAYAKRAGIEIE
jgi:hypothetical protein